MSGSESAPPSTIPSGSDAGENGRQQEMVERQMVSYDAGGGRKEFVLELSTDAHGRINMRGNVAAIEDLWAVAGLMCPRCIFRRRWAFSPRRGYGYAFMESCLHDRSDIDGQLDRTEDAVENTAVANLVPDEGHLAILGDLVVIKIRMGTPDEAAEAAAAEAAAAEKAYLDADILDIDESEVAMVDRLVRRYALYESNPRGLFYKHLAVDGEEDDFELRNFVGWTEAMSTATAGGKFDPGRFTQSYMREAGKAVRDEEVASGPGPFSAPE
uniref:Uncharacterized protein n=1 Tax=Mycena chlorophos TaxID=658473 RepID=A0ABQ0KWK4_MYCCL|nr:predicted protein [Mycena chlorophos]